MKQMLDQRKEALHQDLRRMHRLEIIKRERASPDPPDPSFSDMTLPQLFEKCAAGQRAAYVSLGNRLIASQSDRAAAVGMGLAERVMLKGELGSWLVDICVYERAPYDLLQFLPSIDQFLLSRSEKVLLRSLYILRDLITFHKGYSESIFRLANFGVVLGLVSSQEQILQIISSEVVLMAAASSEKVCGELRGMGLSGLLIVILQSRVSKLRAKGLMCLGCMARHSPEVVADVLKNDTLSQTVFLASQEDNYQVRKELYGLLASFLKHADFQSFGTICDVYLLELLKNGLRVEPEEDCILEHCLESILSVLETMCYCGQSKWEQQFWESLGRLGLLEELQRLREEHTSQNVESLCLGILQYYEEQRQMQTQ